MKKKTQTMNNLDIPPLVILALDFGGSGTKGIYSLCGSSEIYSLFMEPEVGDVTVESVKTHEQNLMGATDPENRVWVSVNGKTKVVGYLAQSKFHANTGLVELKYERAVYKTLAAIWVVKEKLNLPAKMRLFLSVLLPPGEFENKVEFERLVRTFGSNYSAVGSQMQVECLMFKCLPEGAGVFLSHQKRVGQALKQRVCAVVMLGFRNASVLISHRGIVSKEGKMSDLGMVRMLEKVVGATSGQTVERLTKAIAEAGSDIDTRPLVRVLRSRSREGRTSELTKILQVIRTARHEYVAALTSWLDQVVPPDVEEILFCGGTADYLKKELNSHYPAIPCIFSGVSIPKNLDKYSLGNRLADVYSAFLYFDERVKHHFADHAEVISHV
ncbi:ParM/StbA family protein [Nostoc sp. TCL26-01]|uniref:ParM/StbA family protein n=1 Tax=Nostoc sp. TCL26-01 TaxID=2576904 RepID=UPI0015C116F3|nr:ParM/StbA family protein [Nostoc sp. TCL26-01]QLE59792.1 ParM/StbA family protein [Nostoc sp. TCL26-01]